MYIFQKDWMGLWYLALQWPTLIKSLHIYPNRYTLVPGVYREFYRVISVFITNYTNGQMARIYSSLVFVKFVYSCHSWSPRPQHITDTIYLRDVCNANYQRADWIL